MSKLIDSNKKPGVIFSKTRELTSAEKNILAADEAKFNSDYISVNFQIDDIVSKQDSKAAIVQFVFRENSTDKKSSYIITPAGTAGAQQNRTLGCNDTATIFGNTTRKYNFESGSYLAALSYLHQPYIFDTILPKTAADRNWGILYASLQLGQNSDMITGTQLNWPIHRVLASSFSHNSTVYDISKNYVSPTTNEFTSRDINITTELYDWSIGEQKFSNDIHLNIDTFNNITEFTLGFRGVVSAANLDSYIESLSAAPKYRQLFAIDIKGGELAAGDSLIKSYESLNSQHNEKLYSFNQSIANLAIKTKRIKENTWYIEDDEFKTFSINANNPSYYISTANPLDKTTQHNYFTGESFSTNFNKAKLYQTASDAAADIALAESIAGTDCYQFSFTCVTLSQPTVEYNSPATNFSVTNRTYNTNCRFLSCVSGSNTNIRKYYIGDPDNYIPGDMSQWVDDAYDLTTRFALRDDPQSENHQYMQYYCGPSNMPYHNSIGHSDNWALSVSAATNVRDVDYQTIHDLIMADSTLALLVVEQQVKAWMNYTAFRNESRSLTIWQTASADFPGYSFYSQDITSALTDVSMNSIFDRTLTESTVMSDNDKSFFSVPQMDFIALEYIIKPVSNNS